MENRGQLLSFILEYLLVPRGCIWNDETWKFIIPNEDFRLSFLAQKLLQQDDTCKTILSPHPWVSSITFMNTELYPLAIINLDAWTPSESSSLQWQNLYAGEEKQKNFFFLVRDKTGLVGKKNHSAAITLDSLKWKQLTIEHMPNRIIQTSFTLKIKKNNGKGKYAFFSSDTYFFNSQYILEKNTGDYSALGLRWSYMALCIFQWSTRLSF